ncbi:MAG: hypothetical protein H0W68_00180 [Gemmatimonadaceae bacterium]|nr:hypothetical protein [Gemmatimonadaceae bacterium]
MSELIPGQDARLSPRLATRIQQLEFVRNTALTRQYCAVSLDGSALALHQILPEQLVLPIQQACWPHWTVSWEA